jgi:hypothetical protein
MRWEQDTLSTSEKGLVLVTDILLSIIYTRAVNLPDRRNIFLFSKKNLDTRVSSWTRSKTKSASTSVTMVLPTPDTNIEPLWLTDCTLAYRLYSSRLHTQEFGNVVLKKADIVNRPEAIELVKHEILV